MKRTSTYFAHQSFTFLQHFFSYYGIMEASLQQYPVALDLKDYNLRYFYVDEGGIGHYTCGVAYESMMTLLRKYRFDFDHPSCLIGLHFTQDEKAGGHGLAEVMKQRKGSPLHECMLHYKIYERNSVCFVVHILLVTSPRAIHVFVFACRRRTSQSHISRWTTRLEMSARMKSW